jgi:hypothetical protein
MPNIDVRVSEVGHITNGETTRDANVRAMCVLCNEKVEATADIGAAGHACAACLRARLDALSVGRWRLRDSEDSRLPWGKASG